MGLSSMQETKERQPEGQQKLVANEKTKEAE
jgi:hypothetical protein